MLCFPNAKINIGLNITEKRSDGFHNIETIFYPVSLCDALEFTELSSSSSQYTFKNTGICVEAKANDNLIVKAYQLLRKDYNIPSLNIHLHKSIPFGAGLGGGSADAAFMISSINKYFKLDITVEQQEKYASQLGSDCAFFIRNKPTFAYGRGELFTPIDLNLSSYYIIMVKPDVAVSTAQAYANIKPKHPQSSLIELTQLPVCEWEGKVINDFEESIFPGHPQLKTIKEELYDAGALYAAMSGSGSTIYGIFDKTPPLLPQWKEHFTWRGQMQCP